MIYEPSGFDAYKITMHEKDELGNEDFGHVLPFETVDWSMCMFKSVQKRFPCIFIVRADNNNNDIKKKKIPIRLSQHAVGV